MRRALILVSILLAASLGARAQTLSLFATTAVGPAQLGFRSHKSVGFAEELTRSRFYERGAFEVTPDVKTFASHGHSVGGYVSLGVRIAPRVSPLFEYSLSEYWSAVDRVPYTKTQRSPEVGVFIDDKIGGLTVTYAIPTGCVYATKSNPCVLTSPRERGVVGSQYLSLLGGRLRSGFTLGWLNVGDQLNPQVETPQVRHNLVEGYATLEWRLWSK